MFRDNYLCSKGKIPVVVYFCLPTAYLDESIMTPNPISRAPELVRDTGRSKRQNSNHSPNMARLEPTMGELVSLMMLASSTLSSS